MRTCSLPAGPFSPTNLIMTHTRLYNDNPLCVCVCTKSHSSLMLAFWTLGSLSLSHPFSLGNIYVLWIMTLPRVVLRVMNFDFQACGLDILFERSQAAGGFLSRGLDKGTSLVSAFSPWARGYVHSSVLYRLTVPMWFCSNKSLMYAGTPLFIRGCYIFT